MQKRDLSLSIALCASLVLHGLLCYSAFEAYARSAGGRIYLPALPRLTQAIEASASWLPQLVDQDPFRRLGDTDGTGYAIDASPGEQQLLAPQAMLDQPFLSRDPAGPGRVGDEPSELLIPPGDGAVDSDTAPLRASVPATPFAAVPGPAQTIGIPIPVQPTAPPEAGHLKHDRSPPDDSIAAQPETPQVAALVPAAPPAASTAGSESPGRPGPPNAADPAPQGDSEIDPFSIVGTAEFRPGSTTVRMGRKHKITRPRMSLGARVDLWTLGSTRLVLRIRTDAGGEVTGVEVVHSSGSPTVDQIFRVTAYEWWFEPPKDSGGQPRADEFPFRITIN